MDNIEEIFNPLITDEARSIKSYIEKTWGHIFEIKLEKPLLECFPEPENVGLKHIWKFGSADVVVYRRSDNKLIAIIEPGGGQHLKEDKQKKNDDRKFMLCKINKVNCLQLMNGVMGALPKRKWRKLIGGFLFGSKYDMVR